MYQKVNAYIYITYRNCKKCKKVSLSVGSGRVSWLFFIYESYFMLDFPVLTNWVVNCWYRQLEAQVPADVEATASSNCQPTLMWVQTEWCNNTCNIMYIIHQKLQGFIKITHIVTTHLGYTALCFRMLNSVNIKFPVIKVLILMRYIKQSFHGVNFTEPNLDSGTSEFYIPCYS